jgi:hypothetical protein
MENQQDLLAALKNNFSDLRVLESKENPKLVVIV